jgi:hypothetical protein
MSTVQESSLFLFGGMTVSNDQGINDAKGCQRSKTAFSDA